MNTEGQLLFGAYLIVAILFGIFGSSAFSVGERVILGIAVALLTEMLRANYRKDETRR